MTHETVVDSPTGWVAKHIREYVETGGRRGHRRWGVTTLLLTTRGRRTGTLRRTALIYRQDGDRYVVVGSNGGKARHPEWYLNLLADPDVRVQVAAEVLTARAIPATGAQRERLWRLMAEVWPDYDRHQRRTRREIPVVVLTPTGG
jgi:deazaflavin-dependent oxidoreductase (nitroreductase family)